MTAALTHTTTADPPPVGDALPGDGAPASPRRPAAETVRLYAADWNAFLAWCKSEDLAALPAAPATVAAFLNAGVATLSAGALAKPRRLPPLRPARLVRMAGACRGGLADARDRALLLLAANWLGRAALVSLCAEHVRISDAGAELMIVDDHEGDPAEERLCKARFDRPSATTAE